MSFPDSFDLPIEKLRHPDAIKWTYYAPDVLPLWVADMDFDIAPSIRAALHAQMDKTIGYSQVFGDEELTHLLRAKCEKIGLIDLPQKAFHFVSGVVQALYAGIFCCSEKGDEVVTMTPIYPPFLSAIADQGRMGVNVGLIDTEQGWRIDFDALERAFTPKTKVLMLCHPHNPTGRLWTREELSRIAQIAERAGVTVITDELHADLTLDGEFIPFAAVASKELQQRTLTLTGPCKTYNTAGLGIGVVMSHNAELVARIHKQMMGIGGHPTIASVVMWRAALKDDGAWHRWMINSLRDRRAMLLQFLKDRLPFARCHAPEATYLAWLDFRQHEKSETIHDYLLKEAKVGLNPGPIFGPNCDGYVRLNFATSRSILSEALERIAKVCTQI